MPRNFNKTQKQHLFLLADGICQGCGEPLVDTWEADHIKPYSKKGRTELINGQALCRKCNREKGNREMFEPRNWQKRFIETYTVKNQRDFLLVATPGAGKTKATLYLVRGLLDSVIKQIVIVVPTEQLKIQWAKEALSFGIQLHPYWASGPIKQGYNGICLTYAQVSTTVWALNWLCEKSPTFVVFDEIHHAGESLAWGNSIKDAFEHATSRLAESGTPFRSDNNKIPFVTYNSNGESQADFTYDYGRAIVDKVCRSVSFPAFDGMTSWFDGEDIIESNSFDEALDNPKHESQRLRSALDTGNNFISDMLKEAVKKLNDIRIDDPKAGGLIVTIDTRHADAIARLMTEITKEEPTVVHSDINGENSNYLIDCFAKDASKKWLIAVKMVSEGVNIPRLRVGVHATNVLTELSFRQIVGRVIRRQGDDDAWAWFFVPKDGRLVEFMEQIKEERDHVINDTSREIERNGNGDYVRSGDSDFIPVEAERNPKNDITITEGETFTQDFISYAINVAKEVGAQINEAQAALIMKRLQGVNIHHQVTASTPESPLWQKEKSLRQVVNSRAFSAACRIKEKCSTNKTEREIVAKIHYRWTQLGHKKQDEASVEELEQKLKWLSSVEDEYWRFI